ncbi:transposase [Streptomyces sp. NBC_00433]
MTDAQWARIEPLLPDRTPRRGGDRRAPVVAFHLGSAGTETEAGSGDGPAAGAVLLAVRVNDDLLGGWELTPSGEITFAER